MLEEAVTLVEGVTKLLCEGVPLTEGEIVPLTEGVIVTLEVEADELLLEGVIVVLLAVDDCVLLVVGEIVPVCDGVDVIDEEADEVIDGVR